MAEHIMHIASDALSLRCLGQLFNLFVRHAQLGVGSMLLFHAQPVHSDQQ